MPVEIEVKVEVSGFDEVVRKLTDIGAVRVSKVREKNIVYDNALGELKKDDLLLRLRHDVDVESGREHAKITFKGKKIAGKMKKRPEFEVDVSDFSTACRLVEGLGFMAARVYEKVRETWYVSGAEVVLDELPFGKYIEIEGSEDDIRKIAKQLGFSEKKFITENYFKLADKKGVKGDIVFD